MTDEVVETVEEKFARWAQVIDAQAKEIDRLRGEVARLTEGAGALETLQALYRSPDLPEALRAKCAGLALVHEVPRLLPERAAIDATCEEIEPLAQRVARRRARLDRLLALPLEERSELSSPSRNGDNSGGDDSDGD